MVPASDPQKVMSNHYGKESPTATFEELDYVLTDKEEWYSTINDNFLASLNELG